METTEARRLRIFIGETDRHNSRTLYEALVAEALEAGLAGATVLRGIHGYGAHHRIHSSRILRLAEDLPLIVEIVDTPERIEAFLPRVEQLVGEGLITIEPIRMHTCHAKK